MQTRPEDLLARDLRVGRRVRDHRRAEQLAVERAARKDRAPRAVASSIHCEHAIALGLGDQRADVGLLVRRVADFERLDAWKKALEECVVGGRST